MLIIAIIISLCVGFGISMAIFLPKAKNTLNENTKIKELNQSYEIQLQNLIQQKEKIQEEIKISIETKNETFNELERVQTLLKTTQQTAKTAYDNEIEIAKEHFEFSMEQLSKEYQIYEEELKQHYKELQKEFSDDTQNLIDKKQSDLLILQKLLDDFQAKNEALVQAQKREEQKRDEVNFYKLVLSDIDIQEIKRLREIENYLRDSKPLNKVIWKVYYEHPFNDLIGRILGPGKHCGIYKITNLQNKKCYIGQSVNLKERLRQHIRRGIGADETTKNKLYPAMQAIGVENFSFEIIEECSADQLNEKEKYWIEFYHGQDFGYNITAGNK